MIFRQYPSFSLILKKTSHKRFISPTFSAPCDSFHSSPRTGEQVRGVKKENTSICNLHPLSGEFLIFSSMVALFQPLIIHVGNNKLSSTPCHASRTHLLGDRKQTFLTLSSLTLFHRGDYNSRSRDVYA